MDVMRSVLGMVVLLTIAFLLSVNKKKISLRTVGAALVLQVVIGGIMLWLPPGRWVAEKVAFGVHKVLYLLTRRYPANRISRSGSTHG